MPRTGVGGQICVLSRQSNGAVTRNVSSRGRVWRKCCWAMQIGFKTINIALGQTRVKQAQILEVCILPWSIIVRFSKAAMVSRRDRQWWGKGVMIKQRRLDFNHNLHCPLLSILLPARSYAHVERDRTISVLDLDLDWLVDERLSLVVTCCLNSALLSAPRNRVCVPLTTCSDIFDSSALIHTVRPYRDGAYLNARHIFQGPTAGTCAHSTIRWGISFGRIFAIDAPS